MFQFPGFPSLHYGFMQRYCNITCSEFPHSDICGSRLICSSPQLFAACHVLLRRHVPRHPPYALCSLIFLSRLLILTYLQNSLTSTRPNRAILAFRLTLLSYVSVLTNLAFFFVFCLSYFASFSTMQLSIFGCSTYFRNSVHILILGRHRSAPAAFAAWWAHAELPTKMAYVRSRVIAQATCVAWWAQVDSILPKVAYVRSHLSPPQHLLRGGLKWTRTTDLTLIRRVL